MNDRLTTVNRKKKKNNPYTIYWSTSLTVQNSFRWSWQPYLSLLCWYLVYCAADLS